MSIVVLVPCCHSRPQFNFFESALHFCYFIQCVPIFGFLLIWISGKLNLSIEQRTNQNGAACCSRSSQNLLFSSHSRIFKIFFWLPIQLYFFCLAPRKLTFFFCNSRRKRKKKKIVFKTTFFLAQHKMNILWLEVISNISK